jgi:pyruvate dehydrogenase E1 component alpha subunit
MQLIRQFELKAEEMYKMAGKIRGFFHAYIGQEAIAAGCMTATRQEIFSSQLTATTVLLSKGRQCKRLYGRIIR